MSNCSHQPSVDFGYPTPADGPVPAFNTIEEEADFWDTHDLTDFFKDGAEEIELVLQPELHLGEPESMDACQDTP